MTTHLTTSNFIANRIRLPKEQFRKEALALAEKTGIARVLADPGDYTRFAAAALALTRGLRCATFFARGLRKTLDCRAP